MLHFLSACLRFSIGKMFSKLIVFFATLAVIERAATQQGITVITKQGQVKGYTAAADAATGTAAVTEFFGIPYAKPPIGELRWKKPEEAVAWNGVIEAVTADPMGTPCIQRRSGSRKDFNTSEDCLTLNIYTTDVAGDKKAVLFFVHGGGYIHGTAREYNGRFLAGREDVVVVTINYRLNIIGFFDSDGDGVWENYGLWDIKLALQWVQDNIEAFGGDKNRVTIFGGSAGAMAVTQIAASTEFKGLFHRVIGESGNLLCTKLSHRQPQEVHKAVLKYVNCSTAQCLRQTDPDDLRSAVSAIQYADVTYPVMYAFGAYQDGEILKGDPFEAWKFIKTGDGIDDAARQEMISNFQLYDFIGGFNTQEGSLILSTTGRLAESHGFTIEDGVNEEIVDLFLQEYVGAYYPKSRAEKIQRFKEIFFDGGRMLGATPTGEMAQTLLNMYSDLLFTTPTLHLLDSHAEQDTTSTYMYTFTFETEDTRTTRPKWFRGSPHTDERIFVFGEHPTSYNEPNYTMNAEEQQLSALMMRAWANFARTGNPNNADHLDINWNPYTKSRQFFMQFGPEQADVSARLYNMRKIQTLQDVVDNTMTTKPAPAKPTTESAATATAVCLSMFLGALLVQLI